MKYKDVIAAVEKEVPKEGDEVYVDVVNEDNVKTVHVLVRAKIDGEKCIFIAGIGFGHGATEKAMSYSNFVDVLKERADQYANLDCYLKTETGTVVVPMKRAYVSGSCDRLVLEADYREFDKNDKQVIEDVFFNSIYGNRTDAIKELQHVLKGLNMELACSVRDIKFDKTGKDRSRLRAKVKGTATKQYDLRNGSYFHVDKNTYQAFGGKW